METKKRGRKPKQMTKYEKRANDRQRIFNILKITVCPRCGSDKISATKWNDDFVTMSCAMGYCGKKFLVKLPE